MSCHVSFHVWYVTLNSGLWGTAHAASSSHRARNIEHFSAAEERFSAAATPLRATQVRKSQVPKAL